MIDTDIQLVCFDLGGVMVRICRDWPHAIERAGVPIDEISRLADAEDSAEIVSAYETGQIDTDTFCRHIAEQLGMSIDHVLRVIDAWLVEPYDGAHELVDQLADLPPATACLSNTNERHWQQMLGIVPGTARMPLDRFTHRFASFQIGAMKPDEPIFVHVEQQTGIPPQSILYFDDAPPNIDTARRRGWWARLIDPLDDPVRQMIEHLTQAGIRLDHAGA